MVECLRGWERVRQAIAASVDNHREVGRGKRGHRDAGTRDGHGRPIDWVGAVRSNRAGTVVALSGFCYPGDTFFPMPSSWKRNVESLFKTGIKTTACTYSGDNLKADKERGQ